MAYDPILLWLFHKTAYKGKGCTVTLIQFLCGKIKVIADPSKKILSRPNVFLFVLSAWYQYDLGCVRHRPIFLSHVKPSKSLWIFFYFTSFFFVPHKWSPSQWSKIMNNHKIYYGLFFVSHFLNIQMPLIKVNNKISQK